MSELSPFLFHGKNVKNIFKGFSPTPDRSGGNSHAGPSFFKQVAVIIMAAFLFGVVIVFATGCAGKNEYQE